MVRHPLNANLTLINQRAFLDFPIQLAHAPFVLKYLERLFETMSAALHEYPRVFAFRVDLRFPAWFDSMPTQKKNELMTRFIRSFKAKILHNRCIAVRQYPSAHTSTVRYVWAREKDLSHHPHYHVVILLNNDAFFTLGRFESNLENMFNRLNEAWASALDLPIEAVRGLVECPPNSCYYLRRDDLSSQTNFFYRASYLCKAATKVYGDGTHGFGCSRG